jgi:hypothetical protein
MMDAGGPAILSTRSTQIILHSTMYSGKKIRVAKRQSVNQEQHASRYLAVPYTRIAMMCAWQLPPTSRHSVPSGTPMTGSDMDPNSIPDIYPTINHHGMLTFAEANAKLEALAPPQEMHIQQCKTSC